MAREAAAHRVALQPVVSGNETSRWDVGSCRAMAATGWVAAGVDLSLQLLKHVGHGMSPKRGRVRLHAFSHALQGCRPPGA